MMREVERRTGRFTRRALALAVGAGGALRGQPREPLPGDEMTAARERAARNRQELAQTPLPMPVEPAFRFEA